MGLRVQKEIPLHFPFFWLITYAKRKVKGFPLAWNSLFKIINPNIFHHLSVFHCANQNVIWQQQNAVAAAKAAVSVSCIRGSHSDSVNSHPDDDHVIDFPPNTSHVSGRIPFRLGLLLKTHTIFQVPFHNGSNILTTILDIDIIIPPCNLHYRVARRPCSWDLVAWRHDDIDIQNCSQNITTIMKWYLKNSMCFQE